tara:strand:- start:144 stop:1508 length:1365 start_codon:yes stop_codon:yes gene_type:complete
MAGRDGNGNFTLSNPDFTSGTTISSSQVDANNSEIAVALTQSIAVDGQTTTTSSIPFAADIATDVIAELTPGAGVTTDGVLLKDNAITTTKVDTAKGTPIASATTTDIGAATGQYFDISGTTTITGLGTITAGAQRVAQFDGILTLTHNGTSLILPGAANITTAAGDTAGFVSLGSGNWACEWYTAASGQAVVGASAASTTVAGIVELATTAETETGTDTTRAVTPDGLHDMTTLAGVAWMSTSTTLTEDSDTIVASQQSIKAYVDAQIAANSSALEFVGKLAIPNQTTFEISSDAGADIQHAIASGYDYIIKVENFCPASNLTDLYMQYSDDNGTTYESGASDYNWSVTQGVATASEDTDSIIRITDDIGNDTNNSSVVTITLNDPGGTTEYLLADWTGAAQSGNTVVNMEPLIGAAKYNTATTAMNGVQFSFESAGLFKAQGNVLVWRRKRS